MFRKMNSIAIKLFCVCSALLSTSALARSADPSGGALYVEQQITTQGTAIVRGLVIAAMVVGTFFIVFGVMAIPKIKNQQVSDEEKHKIWLRIMIGAALFVIPLIISILTGVWGAGADSAASATQGLDWGIDN